MTAQPAPAGSTLAASDTVPDRHREVETKLDADPGFRLPALTDGPAVRATGVAAADAPSSTLLSATYYDTANLDLLRSRLTLRRRTGGADAGWHLKLPAGAGARTEVRLPLAGGGPGGGPSDGGARRVPVPLAALVAGAARGRELVPVARIDTIRSATLLRDAAGMSLLEVADDSVTGTGLLPEATGEQRWRELEVEITGGTAEHLAAVVDALVTAGARPAAAASKLGRLLGAPAATVSPTAATPTAGTPTAGTPKTGTPTAVTGPGGTAGSLSAAAVLIEYVRGQRDLLIDADIRLRAPDPDGEAPHDARAAARRIRSVLRVYRALFADGPGLAAGPPDGATATIDGVAAALRSVGTSLSHVRDLDVALHRSDLLDSCTPGLGALRDRIRCRRTEALAALRTHLASGEYLSLLRSVDLLASDPALTTAAGASAGSVLEPLLTAAWLRMRADAEAATGSGPAGRPVADPGARDDPGAADPGGEADLVGASQMHRVRKDAKTVRYAADAAANISDPDGPRIASFATRLEEIQDVLGSYQDGVTISALLDRIADSPDLTDSERTALERWRDVEVARCATTLAAFAACWPSLPVLPIG